MPLQAMQLVEILIRNQLRMKSVVGFWKMDFFISVGNRGNVFFYAK